MRSSSGKLLFGTALIGLAMSISACGRQSNDTVDNAEVTDMNAVGTMEGTTNDMSTMDTGTDTNVATDTMGTNNMSGMGNDMGGANAADGNAM